MSAPLNGIDDSESAAMGERAGGTDGSVTVLAVCMRSDLDENASDRDDAPDSLR